MSSNGERRTRALVLALTLAASARAQAQSAPAAPPPHEAPAVPTDNPMPAVPTDNPMSVVPTDNPMPVVPTDNPAPLPAPAHLDANRAATTVEETPPAPPPPSRPRLSVAVGLGTSFESAGLSPARTALVPAFFATGGVGVDWPVGVEALAFASSSSGRFKSPDTPVDRLALSLIGVVRPCLWSFAPGDERYFTRVARTLGLELGLGLEREGTTVRAGSRLGFQAGARVEFPLSPNPATKELRVRLAARHLQGFYVPRVGTVDVGDGFELYAALVSVF